MTSFVNISKPTKMFLGLDAKHAQFGIDGDNHPFFWDDYHIHLPSKVIVETTSPIKNVIGGYFFLTVDGKLYSTNRPNVPMFENISQAVLFKPTDHILLLITSDFKNRIEAHALHTPELISRWIYLDSNQTVERFDVFKNEVLVYTHSGGVIYSIIFDLGTNSLQEPVGIIEFGQHVAGVIGDAIVYMDGKVEDICSTDSWYMDLEPLIVHRVTERHGVVCLGSDLALVDIAGNTVQHWWKNSTFAKSHNGSFSILDNTGNIIIYETHMPLPDDTWYASCAYRYTKVERLTHT